MYERCVLEWKKHARDELEAMIAIPKMERRSAKVENDFKEEERKCSTR